MALKSPAFKKKVQKYFLKKGKEKDKIVRKHLENKKYFKLIFSYCLNYLYFYSTFRKIFLPITLPQVM